MPPLVMISLEGAFQWFMIVKKRGEHRVITSVLGGDGEDGCSGRLGEGNRVVLSSEWHEEPQSRVYDRPRTLGVMSVPPLFSRRSSEVQGETFAKWG